MRSYPSTTRNILSLLLRQQTPNISSSRIPTRTVFRIRSAFRSWFCSRYSSLLRFRRHQAWICAGICHYRAPSTSHPHQYRLPLHDGLHVHLHSFDSTRILLVGLDICSRSRVLLSAVPPVGTILLVRHSFPDRHPRFRFPQQSATTTRIRRSHRTRLAHVVISSSSTSSSRSPVVFASSPVIPAA